MALVAFFKRSSRLTDYELLDMGVDVSIPRAVVTYLIASIWVSPLSILSTVYVAFYIKFFFVDSSFSFATSSLLFFENNHEEVRGPLTFWD
jgi:hypothetical protein